MENDLKVGDTLKISHWEVNGYTEEKQIQISGILRTAKKKIFDPRFQEEVESRSL